MAIDGCHCPSLYHPIAALLAVFCRHLRSLPLPELLCRAGPGWLSFAAVVDTDTRRRRGFQVRSPRSQSGTAGETGKHKKKKQKTPDAGTLTCQVVPHCLSSSGPACQHDGACCSWQRCIRPAPFPSRPLGEQRPAASFAFQGLTNLATTHPRPALHPPSLAWPRPRPTERHRTSKAPPPPRSRRSRVHRCAEFKVYIFG